MKNKDADRISILRMVLSAAKNKEIELRKELDDAEMIKVLRSEFKKRIDAKDAYAKGGRADLSAKEQKESEVIKTYLPVELDIGALKKMIADIRSEGIVERAAIIREVLKRTEGKADGKLVAELAST